MTFLNKKRILISKPKSGISKYKLVTLRISSQTTEIQPFEVDCLSMKTLKFQYDEVIIYEDFEVSFLMCNRLLTGMMTSLFMCKTLS